MCAHRRAFVDSSSLHTILLADQRKKLVEDKRMEELSKDKRKMRKAVDRKKSAEKRKDIRSAPPLRQQH